MAYARDLKVIEVTGKFCVGDTDAEVIKKGAQGGEALAAAATAATDDFFLGYAIHCSQSIIRLGLGDIMSATRYRPSGDIETGHQDAETLKLWLSDEPLLAVVHDDNEFWPVLRLPSPLA